MLTSVPLLCRTCGKGLSSNYGNVCKHALREGEGEGGRETRINNNKASNVAITHSGNETLH